MHGRLSRPLYISMLASGLGSSCKGNLLKGSPRGTASQCPLAPAVLPRPPAAGPPRCWPALACMYRLSSQTNKQGSNEYSARDNNACHGPGKNCNVGSRAASQHRRDAHSGVWVVAAQRVHLGLMGGSAGARSGRAHGGGPGACAGAGAMLPALCMEVGGVLPPRLLLPSAQVKMGRTQPLPKHWTVEAKTL